PSAPSLEPTRQRKLFPSRSNSIVSMITGLVNNSRCRTGWWRISSSLAYFACRASLPRATAARDDNGNVAAAPPTRALAMNLRRLVFIGLEFWTAALDLRSAADGNLLVVVACRRRKDLSES